MEVSIVIPLYNEEESVDALHREVTAAAERLGREYELILVDDGSRDGTVEKLRAICERDPRVKAVRFRRNYGQTAALQAGFDQHRARQFGQSKYGISRIWKVFLDLLTVKMLLGFTTRPALWFGLLSLPFLIGMVLAFATSVYVHYVWTPFNEYPLVFPAATLLFAFAFAHLIVIGFFAELVVKVGDFKEVEAVLAAVELGGNES